MLSGPSEKQQFGAVPGSDLTEDSSKAAIIRQMRIFGSDDDYRDQRIRAAPICSETMFGQMTTNDRPSENIICWILFLKFDAVTHAGSDAVNKFCMSSPGRQYE